MELSRITNQIVENNDKADKLTGKAAEFFTLKHVPSRLLH